MSLFDSLMIKYKVMQHRRDRYVARKKSAEQAIAEVDKELLKFAKRLEKEGRHVSLDALAHEIAHSLNDQLLEYSAKAHPYKADERKKGDPNSVRMLIDVKVKCEHNSLKFCSEQFVSNSIIVYDEMSGSGYHVKPEALASFPIEPNIHLLAQKGIVGKAYLSLLERQKQEVSRR